MKSEINTTQSRSKILVGVEEAAHLLSMSRTALFEMLKDESGPTPIGKGKKLRFMVKELERWAEEQTVVKGE